jgi:hypothetical protein
VHGCDTLSVFLSVCADFMIVGKNSARRGSLISRSGDRSPSITPDFCATRPGWKLLVLSCVGCCRCTWRSPGAAVQINRSRNPGMKVANQPDLVREVEPERRSAGLASRRNPINSGGPTNYSASANNYSGWGRRKSRCGPQ